MLGTKGKTTYCFAVADALSAEKTVQDWLNANGFQQMQEDGETFYRSGDALLSGYRFFEYAIEGTQITIDVYLGSRKKPIALSDGLVSAMAITAYKNLLDSLISILNGGVANPQNIQNEQGDSMQVQQNNNYNNFHQEADKRNGKMAEISFWFSILVLACSLLGASFGAILVIANYYMAALGLKSKKRGKAIAAIVMTSVALLITIVTVLAALGE